MAEAVIKISYCYKSQRYSTELIRHIFKYLSIITGIQFNPDDRSPLISNTADFKTSKYIIPTDNDEIAAIASRLSLSLKMGPYSNDRHAPSNEPLISEIVSSFCNKLKQAGIVPERQPVISLWPEKSCFGLAVTHDVDILRRTILGGLRLWVNGHLPGGMNAVFDSVKWRMGLNLNPYNCLAKWQKMENEIGLNSTYFIFAGRRQHNFDPVYNLSWLPFENIPNRAISLHSSIGCYMGQGLCEPKNQLESISKAKIAGIRPHYLSAFMPEFWQAAYDSGFEYSSSLGFDDAIGYMHGIDLPFYPFDTASDKPIPILEIPIAIMDCGLIGNSDTSDEAVLARGIGLLERVARSGGLIVLDWHQRTLYNRDYPGWGALFEKLVMESRARRAYFATLEEINGIMKSRIEPQL
jgi:hypothetical protein